MLILFLSLISATELVWEPSQADPETYLLKSGEKTLGIYDLRDGIFWKCDEEGEGAKRDKAPIAPPGSNFGLSARTLSEGCSGAIVSDPSAAKQAIANATAANIRPGGIPRVNVIGTDTARRGRTAKEVRAALAQVGGAVPQAIVEEWTPEEWQMKAGFSPGPDVSVVVQLGTGEVIHRQNEPSGAPEAVIGALRDVDPRYDPAQDPDRRRKLSIPGLSGMLGSVPEPVSWAIGILAVLLLFWPTSSRAEGQTSSGPGA